MKANLPNQRATKTRNTTVAMIAPRIPRKPVTDTSVLGGLKCDGKAVWEKNTETLHKVRKKNVMAQGMLVVAVLPEITGLFKRKQGTHFYRL